MEAGQSSKECCSSAEAVMLGALAPGVNGPTWNTLKIAFLMLGVCLAAMLGLAFSFSDSSLIFHVTFLVLIAGTLFLLLSRNAILNLSKSSYKCPSIHLRPKVSRVCFTSASRRSEGRNAADDDTTKDHHPNYDADEAVKVTMDRAKGKTREMEEKAKGRAEAMKDKTNDADGIANEIHEKTKENLGSMAGKAHETKDKAVDSAGKMADKAKEQTKDAADNAAEKTKEYAHGAKDSTKGVADKMADTAQSLGEQAKQTVQKIKETVMGKSADDDDVGDLDDYMKDYEKKVEREGKKKDLRRRSAEEQQDQNQ